MNKRTIPQEIWNKHNDCRFRKLCKSTLRGTWVDCSLGKGLVCVPQSDYCKYERRNDLKEKKLTTKEIIKLVIKKLNISQADLDRVLGINHSTLNYTKANKESKLSSKVLYAFKEKFGIDFYQVKSADDIPTLDLVNDKYALILNDYNMDLIPNYTPQDLKECRLKMKMSLRDFAKVLNVSDGSWTALSRMEDGSRKISKNVLKGLHHLIVNGDEKTEEILKIPSYVELLDENKKLKEELRELKGEQ